MNLSSYRLLLTPKTPTQHELFALDEVAYAQVENQLLNLNSNAVKEKLRQSYINDYLNPALSYFDPSKNKTYDLAYYHDVPKFLRTGYALNKFKETLELLIGDVLNQYNHDFEGFAQYAKTQINELISKTLAQQNPRTINHQLITETLQRTFNKTLNGVAKPFHQYSFGEVQNLAQDIARNFELFQARFIGDLNHIQTTCSHRFSDAEIDQHFKNLYLTIAQVCEKMGFILPQYARYKKYPEKGLDIKKIDREIIQVQSAKWWKRTLKKLHIQINEHLRIACAEVSRKTSLYVSVVRIKEFQRDQEEQLDFLRFFELVNAEDETEVKELIDMYFKSSASPAKRATKISVQNNGIMNSLSPLSYKTHYSELEGIDAEELTQEQAQRQSIWESLNYVEKSILQEAFQQGEALAGNYQPVFFTLTAPSKYHAINSQTMERNPNWNGFSPRRTHREYLNKVWQKFRANMAKYGVKFAGLRVAEPHHDGTPHWHLLLHASREVAMQIVETPTGETKRYAYLIQEGDSEPVLKWLTAEEAPANEQPIPQYAVLIYYFHMQAMQEDGFEAGADKYRFNYKILERRTYIDENGVEREVNPAVYMAKYIRKNILGNNLDADLSDEMLDLNGNPVDHNATLNKTALNASCWASTWGIRQFQFIGNVQSGVWEECRKYQGNLEQLSDEDPLTSTIIKTADKGDFATFLLLKATKGVFSKRKESHLTLYYEDKESETTGLTYKKRMGIETMESKANGSFVPIITKLKNWIKRKKSKTKNSEQNEHTTYKTKQGVEEQTPWDCVINCNRSQNEQLNDFYLNWDNWKNPPPIRMTEYLKLDEKSNEIELNENQKEEH